MSLLGYVPVNRGSTTSMNQMLAQCRHWLRRGIPMLIFPEGTCSQQGLMRFMRGAFQLALEEHVSVVPVVIEGTPQLLEGDGLWMSPRASIRMRVLPPMPPESFAPGSVALAEPSRCGRCTWTRSPPPAEPPPCQARPPTGYCSLQVTCNLSGSAARFPRHQQLAPRAGKS